MADIELSRRGFTLAVLGGVFVVLLLLILAFVTLPDWFVTFLALVGLCFWGPAWAWLTVHLIAVSPWDEEEEI